LIELNPERLGHHPRSYLVIGVMLFLWLFYAVYMLAVDPLYGTIMMFTTVIVLGVLAVQAFRAFDAYLYLAMPEIAIADRPLTLGTSFQVRLRQGARLPTMIDQLRIQLLLKETITGTDTHTQVITETILTDLNITPTAPFVETVMFTVPADAIETIRAPRHRIEWQIGVTATIRQAGRMHNVYPIVVGPEISL
jgi:hypothetical protein